jgi:PTS system mannose-specific IID component
MTKATVIKIFLRSLFIHTTLNFRRMQNLGFALSIIPLVRQLQKQHKDVKEILLKHLQMFNTHPYFSAPIIGSIVRLETDCVGSSTVSDTVAVKQSLMGPYAAIGDIFFWGALRPFAAVFAVVLAYAGLIIAPLAFLLIYTPAHIWVRCKGFIESYRRGKQGIEFIRIMDLPRTAIKIRWGLILILAGLAHWLLQIGAGPFTYTNGVIMKLMGLGSVVACFWLINKGISQVYILYTTAAIFLFISWKEILK